MRSYRPYALCIGLLAAGACLPQKETSHSQEGIDSNNRFDILDIKGSPVMDDIRSIKRVGLDRLPWTDTYWPFTGKGLARRWDVVSPNDEKDPAIWPSTYFRTHVESAYNALQVNPMLSPAEKYDMLFRWRHNKSFNWERLRAVLEPMHSLEEKIHATSDLAERKGFVREIYKQFTGRERDLFRESFPMTGDGWSNWLNYTGQPDFKYLGEEGSGKDWHWMGYCHGWAPAALMAETPKHAVLVRFGWQEILMTEGDIRGLLTKSWADFWPAKDLYFLGRRCNKSVDDTNSEIPHGASGKGFYGSIVMNEAERTFYVKAEYFASFVGPLDRVYPVSFEGEGGAEAFLLEKFQEGSRDFRYVYAPTLLDLQRYVEAGTQDNIVFPNKVELYGCWDVNPASFHMALLQKLGKEKQGIVIDRTRTGQVWNQPVYEAKFTFGEPLLAAGAADVAAAYRAPGTKYLLPVLAEVKWTSEPAKPRMVYPAGFDKRYLTTSRYEYTLEFDRANRLIGGEWGSLDKLNPKQLAPDFIFGFKEGSKPYDDLSKGFDYSGLIEKIHDCSLSPRIDGTMWVVDQNIAFTRCDIEQL